MKTLLIAFGLALLSAGAASAAPRDCPDGMSQASTAELFFGRAVVGAPEVSEADWRRFVDEEVTPRFPDGLSVTDVYGQWRGPKGDFVRENSKALFLVLSGGPDQAANVGYIRDAYKRRFSQQSVLLVEQLACVSF